MKIRPKNGHFDRFLSQLMINIDIKVYSNVANSYDIIEVNQNYHLLELVYIKWTGNGQIVLYLYICRLKYSLTIIILYLYNLKNEYNCYLHTRLLPIKHKIA